MKIAIIGAGRVGRALGQRWSDVGHSVHYGVRDPKDAKHVDLTNVTSVAAAVEGANAALIALPWDATKDALEGLPVGDALILDATNPLAASARASMNEPEQSGAELVSAWLGSSRVVKAFNTTGSANMANPGYGSQRIMMPVAGDDATAKATAIDLANAIGFEGVDAGPLSAARDLEHLAALWIRLAYPLGNGPDIAFGLLRR